ncbi:Haloalkane dehalogenase [Methylobacterium crusticola]|uniref:Haloalkane dehalogenase n=1 Tax=Methylobacterium crusticola TaxID=1697972 RepID=A0ABQ4R6M8_9HYPH|nr:alpha/beta hydrolase [Methylobacterium crusticola]GJD53363.1 Haloalkane dehalogenase [Methylobacterium crusticola]
MLPTAQWRASKRVSRRVSSGVAKTVANSVTKLLRSGAELTGAAAREGRKAARQVGNAVTVMRAAPGADAARPSGQFVDVDGLQVHYIARGKGRPVVLIHGNGTMAEDFVICGLVDRLAKRYRVIAIDRPGFGHTERPRHRIWTAAAQARLVRRVLERLGVERPVLVGHSWGTLVALTVATQAPDAVRGLVLLSGYYYAARRADVALLAPLAVPGVGDAARSLMPAAIGHLLAPQVFRHVFRPQSVPASFQARFPVGLSIHPTQARASAEDTASMNAAAAQLRPCYGGLRVPLAILSGDADAIVNPAGQSCRLHEEVAGSTLTLLPGLGHMIHYAAKPQIVRAVDTVLAADGKSLRWA